MESKALQNAFKHNMVKIHDNYYNIYFGCFSVNDIEQHDKYVVILRLLNAWLSQKMT